MNNGIICSCSCAPHYNFNLSSPDLKRIIHPARLSYNLAHGFLAAHIISSNLLNLPCPQSTMTYISYQIFSSFASGTCHFWLYFLVGELIFCRNNQIKRWAIPAPTSLLLQILSQANCQVKCNEKEELFLTHCARVGLPPVRVFLRYGGGGACFPAWRRRGKRVHWA